MPWPYEMDFAIMSVAEFDVTKIEHVLSMTIPQFIRAIQFKAYSNHVQSEMTERMMKTNSNNRPTE